MWHLLLLFCLLSFLHGFVPCFVTVLLACFLSGSCPKQLINCSPCREACAPHKCVGFVLPADPAAMSLYVCVYGVSLTGCCVMQCNSPDCNTGKPCLTFQLMSSQHSSTAHCTACRTLHSITALHSMTWFNRCAISLHSKHACTHVAADASNQRLLSWLHGIPQQ